MGGRESKGVWEGGREEGVRVRECKGEGGRRSKSERSEWEGEGKGVRVRKEGKEQL